MYFCPSPQGTFGNDYRHFCLSPLGEGGGGGATNVQWVEVRLIAKSPTMHRTAPTAQNNLAPNVNSNKAEKPSWVRGTILKKRVWEILKKKR